MRSNDCHCEYRVHWIITKGVYCTEWVKPPGHGTKWRAVWNKKDKSKDHEILYARLFAQKSYSNDLGPNIAPLLQEIHYFVLLCVIHHRFLQLVCASRVPEMRMEVLQSAVAELTSILLSARKPIENGWTSNHHKIHNVLNILEMHIIHETKIHRCIKLGKLLLPYCL